MRPLIRADLQSFPLVTKRELKDNFTDFCSDTIVKNWVGITRTSGTSGVPLTIPFDRASLNRTWVTFANQLSRLGLSRAELNARNWTLELLTDFATASEITVRVEGFTNLTVRRRIVSRDSTTSHQTALATELLLVPNSIWTGKPTTLMLLHQILKRLNIIPPEPKLILSSAETLTETTRNFISERFCAPTYNVYAMAELDKIACECVRQDGLHYDRDRLWIEVADCHAGICSSGSGEFVITELINTAMPLIRYCTGDTGSLNQNHCACGLSNVLKIGQGRIVYYFQRHDRTLYNPHDMAPELERCGFAQYKVTQTSFDEILLEFVTNREAPNVPRAVAAIKNLCGNVDVLTTHRTELTETSSKRSNMISKLPSPFQPSAVDSVDSETPLEI